MREVSTLKNCYTYIFGYLSSAGIRSSKLFAFSVNGNLNELKHFDKTSINANTAFCCEERLYKSV